MSTRDLSHTDFTGHRPYHRLQGVLRVGYRILNAKQIAVFRRAIAKTGLAFRRDNQHDGLSRNPADNLLVQLHRNEWCLNPAESARYSAIMHRAGWSHMIKR